ncbi:MAG: biotin/lipoyl-containing protein, partial [Acinetobacter sp.]|uniref:biotin/lipoyl-containing protein n=1 Tax=Acinetobacter sp. TaxID=472 RepID=UPI002FC5DEC4
MGVDKATVAEILVKVGDTIAIDDSIVLLESDKASVEVPSTSAGVVKSIAVSEGDEVSEGAVLIEVESADASASTQESVKAEPAVETQTEVQPVAAVAVSAAPATSISTQIVDVKVPDIGVEKALVGEILVKVGDEIAVDDSIVVVESDKATVEVPSAVAGTVESVVVKEGD